jgi:hypothetical protein
MVDAAQRRGWRVYGAFIYRAHRLQLVVVQPSAFVIGSLLVGGRSLSLFLHVSSTLLANTVALRLSSSTPRPQSCRLLPQSLKLLTIAEILGTST